MTLGKDRRLTVRLSIDNKVDITLTIKPDLLATMLSYFGKPQASKKLLQRLDPRRIWGGKLDKLETIGSQWIESLRWTGQHNSTP